MPGPWQGYIDSSSWFEEKDDIQEANVIAPSFQVLQHRVFMATGSRAVGLFFQSISPGMRLLMSLRPERIFLKSYLAPKFSKSVKYPLSFYP